MPRQKSEEDIFKDSTMTFGEHLEELRVCLFRSVAGLFLGLIVGLMVGTYVVEFIQTPLEKALTTYLKQESLERVTKELNEAKRAGIPLPYAPEQVEEEVRQRDRFPEQVFIDPQELLRALKLEPPPPAPAQAEPQGQAAEAEPSSAEPEAALAGPQLVPLFIWRDAKDDPRVRPKSLAAHEPFMIYLKASLLVGVVLASPWIFYQIWSFVAAGLYPHEKRYVHLYLPFSVLLFLGGVSVAFFLVFEPVLKFLFTFNRYMGIAPDPRISEWLSFALMLPLGFGVAFQLPLVMLFLERIGIFTAQIYLSYWKVAILVIFVIAAIFTPPDPWSMSLLALPLTFLYFGGILLCKLMPKGPGLLPAEE